MKSGEEPQTASHTEDTMFKLTDNLGNGATATVEDTDDVRATLNGWFDITNAEVSEMIDGLITALDRHEYTGDLETGLGITVERI